ncbi:mannose-6-phosphate isomerase, class I [Phaeodactylibacter luteus]|uniref:mannose-6-phosphate isomerase n=1 Tax=Phaeodactylibacter luteus TaxID=1564516 RepID=A0A5C6RMU1_9BACT|nr:mannose-6-phosphate isomerase, class I [Phaeodactylibacter luteus]TXB63249.1 mannose-6-phosphate isomerase, class I [Phaeodactylibacter luteus]
MKNQVYLLEGVVQDYAWGGYDFIPELTGFPRSGQPAAEYWLGAHNRGEATVLIDGGKRPLGQLLRERPEWLGPKVVKGFAGELPFLFKVLDVREMLSIQSHPNKAQAKAGFARENQAGIPIDAPYRNFKDDNHKPEVMVALTDFWLLHGFRPALQLEAVLASREALWPVRELIASRGLPKAYEYLMACPQSEVDQLLLPLYRALSADPPSGRENPDFWAYRAFQQYTKGEGEGFDRGVFSVYLLNLVYVAPGQGIYQGAGIPHAYLEGANMELMANSDNVFRGGLTVKHIDVPELMNHLVFDPVAPKLIEGSEQGALQVFQTPAEDFELRRIQLGKASTYDTGSAKHIGIAIVLGGKVAVGEGQQFSRGQAFLWPAGTALKLRAIEAADLFWATLPG